MNRIGVYNPDGKNFTAKYDLKGDKNPLEYTVPARDIAYFIPVVANHVKTALATHLLHKRGVQPHSNPEKDLQEIMEELKA